MSSVQSISGLGLRCLAIASTSSSNKSVAPTRTRASRNRSTRPTWTVVPRASTTNVARTVGEERVIELEVPTIECNVEDEMEYSFDDGYFAPVDGCSDMSLMAGELLKGDVLHSTTYHKVIIGSTAVLASALLLKGFSEAELSHGIAAVLAGYIFADFGSGMFHWGTDNYGSEKTPLLGGVIAAFQGHHLFPWTITNREFCNNIHKVATPAIPTMALALASPLHGSGDIFLSVFTVLVVLSQQFHSWSHSRKSQLPTVVVKLQDMGILISRKSHGAHHRVPFNGNYCIVSGQWNSFLDNSGFFRAIENQIVSMNGVEPRCWNDEPDYTWLTGSLTAGKNQTAARISQDNI